MKDWENSINVWAAKINIGDYLPGNLIKIFEPTVTSELTTV